MSRNILLKAFGVAALSMLAGPLAGCGAGDVSSEAPFEDDEPIGEVSQAVTANQYAFNISATYLADPDVYVESTSLWLTGTPSGASTTVPFYQGISTTGVPSSLTYKGAFNPSSSDNTYDYCNVWAPNLIKKPNGVYRLSFVADRYNPNSPYYESCGVNQESVYYVEASSIASFYNGTQLTVNVYPQTGSNPYTVQSNVWNIQAMRLDPDLFDDGTNAWMSYTWFTGNGNALAYFNRNSSTSAGTALVSHPPATERYNSHRVGTDGMLPIYEASDIIKRGSYYYLFYSAGSFMQDYNLKVRRATTVPGLATATTRQLTFPLYDGTYTAVENHGHSSTFLWNGEWYIAYHIGVLTNGVLTSRKPYYSKLEFDTNNDVKPLIGKLLDEQTSTFRLRNKNSSLCADVPNGHLYETQINYGLRLQQWDCNPYDAQKWNFINVKSDTGTSYGYLVRSKATGLCMTAENGSMTAGQRIVQRPCTGANDQLFDRVYIPSTSYYQLKPRANSAICLEIDSGSTTAGAQIMMWTCATSNNNHQIWYSN